MSAVWTEQEHEAATFEYAALEDAIVQGCRFVRCNFRQADLRQAQLTNCLFERCDFTGARLNGAILTESACLNCRFSLANLFAAEFHECKMTGSSFEEANLGGIRIAGGDWSYTLLRFHDLRKRDLRGVRLNDADLYECDLRGSDLRDTDLTHANLVKTRLDKTDLRGAKMDGVDFRALDLKTTRLDFVQAVLLARLRRARRFRVGNHRRGGGAGHRTVSPPDASRWNALPSFSQGRIPAGRGPRPTRPPQKRPSKSGVGCLLHPTPPVDRSRSSGRAYWVSP